MRQIRPRLTAVLIAPFAALFVLFSGATADPIKSGSAVDPLQLYGDTIDFDVYRKGKNVGSHRVRFTKTGRDLNVDILFRLELKVLFAKVYQFTYRSKARWRQGQVGRLAVDVDDNGEISTLRATRQGDRLQIVGPEKTQTVASPLFPTNHWNPGVLSQTRVLNTITGNVNKIRIRPGRREMVQTERGKISATRYVYTGELDTEVWYDDSGRWVKMRFKAKDGSTIEYACRRCQGEKRAAGKS